MITWDANDGIGAKRAFNTIKRLKRASPLEASQAMAGAVVCGFITEAEILEGLRQVSAPVLEATIESYRRSTAEWKASGDRR